VIFIEWHFVNEKIYIEIFQDFWIFFYENTTSVMITNIYLTQDKEMLLLVELSVPHTVVEENHLNSSYN
jgi:hypothetical protein